MKKKIMILVRKLGLIIITDRIRYFLSMMQTYSSRKQFFKENPDAILPPSYYMYETFSLNYKSFYHNSVESAKWLLEYFEKYKKLDNIQILDWGCGPGRVITHMPKLLPENCTCAGTDYNKKYIAWCNKNIKNVTFKTNQLEPPLQFDAEQFDIVYGISIFTHLSEQMHFAWFNELMRVIKPQGILLITLHGDAFIERLSDEEKIDYEQGKLAVKSNTKEGHRTYAAFQPKLFVQKMVGKHTILEHVQGVIKNGKPDQDVWIIQKVG